MRGRAGVRDRIRASRGLGPAYRALVAVVGLAIVVCGIALLPLPGPGWLIIFVGLGVLASEFEWAQRLLRFAREKVTAWTRWIAGRPTAIRALLAGACLAAVVAAAFGYFAWRGVPSWVPWSG